MGPTDAVCNSLLCSIHLLGYIFSIDNRLIVGGKFIYYLFIKCLLERPMYLVQLILLKMYSLVFI